MTTDATPTAPARPGFDGATFAEEKIRDYDGRGKRELVRRIRYDVIESLYRRYKLITLEQREAAVRLQVDDQLAQTVPQARWGEAGGGKSVFGIADAILGARGRVRRCQGQITDHIWSVVECIALHNFNITDCGKLLRMERLRVVPRLRDGLDIVSKFYDREPSPCEY